MPIKPTKKGKNRAPTIKVGAKIKISNLPPGTVVNTGIDWHFFAELTQKLDAECGNSLEDLKQIFMRKGTSEEVAETASKIIKTKVLTEDMSFSYFQALPQGGEVRVAEEVIGDMLLSLGYSYSNPGTRALMGQKMFDSVTSLLLTNRDKLNLVMITGEHLVQRFISRS